MIGFNLSHSTFCQERDCQSSRSLCLPAGLAVVFYLRVCAFWFFKDFLFLAGFLLTDGEVASLIKVEFYGSTNPV